MKKCLTGVVLCAGLFITTDLSAQVKEFEVINRRPLPTGGAEVLGISKNKATIFYQIAKENEKFVYKVNSTAGAVTIRALTNIEITKGADRIVTYGDELESHLALTAYVRFYTGTGTLLKSVGPVVYGRYIATLADNGDFIIAGNKYKSGMDMTRLMVCFNKNGEKLWERNLPEMVPQAIYSAPDRKYIALVLYHPETSRSNISYYNQQGNILYSNWADAGVSGIEFLPVDKVVVAYGSFWRMYNLTSNNTVLFSGKLEGETIGQHPVTAYPAKNMFFIVSVANESTGYRLQAFDSKTGSLLSESTYSGKPYWRLFRQVQIMSDDSLSLLTTAEIIDLKMK